jgi:low temperature requirement protein LtrA
MTWPPEIESARLLDQLERSRQAPTWPGQHDSGQTTRAGQPLAAGRPVSKPRKRGRRRARGHQSPLHTLEQEHRVAPLELFFDLVFVFAFTQVVMVIGTDPSFAGIGHGVLVLSALWWVWVLYASLTNIVSPEHEMVGAALVGALIAIFVAALAVPGAFGEHGALFGGAFLLACLIQFGLYALAAWENPDLLRAVLRLAPWSLLGAALILVAGLTDSARIWLWLAALTFAYLGASLSGSAGWLLHPSHLIERYSLVIIVALGEAFISIGIGADGTGLGTGELLAAVLGLLVAVSFWLSYSDFFSVRGGRTFGSLHGRQRVVFARDAYVYGHLPMIVGIVFFAAAMRNIVVDVGQELNAAIAFALCGGSALYLLAYSAIRTRFEHRLTVSWGHFVAAVLLVVAIPALTTVPALVAVGYVAAVWLALHGYEIAWSRRRSDLRRARPRRGPARLASSAEQAQGG